MSHYTNQNPISEQAWMNSVLGQMGRKKSSKYVKENNDTDSSQEVSELVDSINKLSNILSSNNNNLPTDPIAMEEFVEKLDVLGDLIGNLMEADEEPSIKLQGRKHSPEAINQALLARAKQKPPEKRTEKEKALVAKEQERLKKEKDHKAKVEKEIADGTRKRGQPKMTRGSI